MLYPVIDIGSNTVKLAVLDSEQLFSQAPVFFKAIPLNLRSKVQGGKLCQSAIEEVAALVKEFIEIAGRLTPAPPIAFATASLRGLENAEEAADFIRNKGGIRPEILSGETEAFYSFLGAKGNFSVKNGITVDLGGGSTEILAFRRNNVIHSVSLPFGCLTLFHEFFENGKNDWDGCRRLIWDHLKKAAPPLPGNSILLSGGSAKAILKYKNFLENKHSFSLGIKQIKKVERHFNDGKEEEKKSMEEILKDRFRLIPPAVSVFSQIIRFYGKEQVLVSRCGVREGCLYHYLQKK